MGFVNTGDTDVEIKSCSSEVILFGNGSLLGICFVSLCIFASLVYAERVIHPTANSLLAPPSSSILRVLFRCLLEDCMEGEQIKP